MHGQANGTARRGLSQGVVEGTGKGESVGGTAAIGLRIKSDRVGDRVFSNCVVGASKYIPVALPLPLNSVDFCKTVGFNYFSIQILCL